MADNSSRLYSFAAATDYTNNHAASSSQSDYSSAGTPHSNYGHQSSTKRATSPILDAAILEKKRKNASAQAAFRARRSTYISNLEETVTSLESVVRRLQDALRDAHDDASELREENVRLKALIVGFEERERIWKAYAKATAGTPAAVAATTQLAAMPPASHPTHHQSSQPLIETPLSSTGSLHDHSAPSTSYGEEGTVYGDDPYSFGKAEDCDGDPLRGNMMHSQNLRLYPTSGQTTLTSSPTTMTNFSMDHADSSNSSGHMAGIPPTPASSVDCNFGGLTSMAYASSGNDGQFCVDPNMPPPSTFTSGTYLLPAFDMSNYSASQRRSLTGSMSSDSTAVESDHMETSPEDKESESGRRSTRRHSYAPFPAPLPPVPRASSRGSKQTRGAGADLAGMSNTLAVIKAQAFGNVRKTRARAKKNPTSGDAAKAAIEILEARGLGLGLDLTGSPKKRKRGDAAATPAPSARG